MNTFLFAISASFNAKNLSPRMNFLCSPIEEELNDVIVN